MKRASGLRPTLASTCESGTPVQPPIADQPCSQACSVICVRAGIALSSASVKAVGRSTRPLTGRRQSENPAAFERR